MSRSTTTTLASNDETKIAIDALLSLSSDLLRNDYITKENVTLMPTGSVAKQQNVDTSRIETETIRGPLNPLRTQPNPPIPAPILTPQAPPVPALPQKKPDDKQDTSESTDSQSTSMDTNSTSNKKKGTLAWRAKPVRLFKCGVHDCNQVFGSVKDLNQHHQDNHPLVNVTYVLGNLVGPMKCYNITTNTMK